jgi:hypothetical protein
MMYEVWVAYFVKSCQILCVWILVLLQYKPLSETESSQESDCGEGPSSQGEEYGDSSSQVTSQETGTEDEGTNATTAAGKLGQA